MMISRALLIALYSTLVTSLTPLAPLAAPGDDDCALYLTGPGRSSAYDYSLNLLKGNFAYDGQHTCITYEAINQAYLDARSRILVSQPKGDWHAEDFASVGELILDISISLARTYGLTYEEIEKGLPLIDTSRTLIREVCPPVFSHVECRAGKYRRLDGLCNNLHHPTWGATMAPFQRLIGPLFADGINAPRIAHTGRDLPLSRVVSRTMHQDEGYHDHAGTVMVIAWGQFMDHDYTLTGTPLDPINRNDPEECCKRPQHLKHPYCNEIRIPDDDYFYRLFGVKCIDFVRGFPSPRPGCKLGSRVPFNTLTGAIDGNTVYGVTEKFARKLRTGYGGLLRMNPVFKEYGLKDLLPLKLDIPDEGCTRPNKNMYCFEAGEIRVNEQLVLTVMHTLMAREHNRVAKGLAGVNPHWDDETLFQEARRINIAEIQHITYNEFLPILLGKDVMEKFGLVLEKQGYWDGYDPHVNPDVIDSFASAAYRFGHSLLPTAVERWSKAHKFIASKRLSDLIRRPYDLYRAGVLDEYVMGLMNQVAQAMDDSITQEVTNHLFKKVGARFGMDLVSFNMQRGREFGIPGYMEYRKFCGLSDASRFEDLFGSMPNETLRKYETIFEHPIDIDLWSGGVSERPLRGSMLGPTFACIIATQFSYSRRGDRFWFELPNQPSSFTSEQLAEIRKSRLARVICDNTDIIDTVQLYPMVLPDHELNPRVPCRSGILPSMDFSKWAEPVPFAGAAKQYITDAIVLNVTENNTLDNNTMCKNITLIRNNNTHAEYVCREMTVVEKKENNLPKTGFNDKVKSEKAKEHKPLESPKNNELNSVFKKSTGPKNNMLRKKRDAPLIYDYVTNHTPGSGNLEREVIKKTNLADFNIKTLHNPQDKIDSQEIPFTKEVIRDETSESDSNNANNDFKKNSRNIDETSEEYITGRNKNINREKLYKEPYLNKNKDNIDVNVRENGSDEKINTKNAQEIDESGENYNRGISRSNENYEEVERPFTDYSKRDEPSVEDNDKQTYSKSNLGNSDINISSSENENSRELSKKHFEKKEPSPASYENDSSEIVDSVENAKSNHANNNLDEINSSKKYTESDENQSGVTQNESGSKYSIDPLPRREKIQTEHSDENSNENSNLSSIESSEQFREKTHVPESHRDSDEIIRNITDDFNDSKQLKNSNNYNSGDSLEQNDLNEKRNNIDQNVSNESNISNRESDESSELINKKDKTYNSSDIVDNGFKSTSNNSKIRNIQDDEIKPVIELNNESGSDESTEESPLAITTTLNNPATKLQTNDKKVNLKQQVERIPLDYKHADDTEKTDKEANDPIDENLYIRLSDIDLKLPEIKLPDDILTYNYEEPTYKRKSTFNHDESEEEPQSNKKSHQSYDGRNRYKDNSAKYNKNSEKSDEEDGDHDDEDLYEKFVRERFGKRHSKKDKTAKYILPNKELYSALQNVLKKTEKIQQDAEKSGDPNAGYAWTLEYGQKL